MHRIEYDRRYIIPLMVIVLATFMDGVDSTVVSIALPEIATHFEISPGDSALVITAYSLMMAGLILIFGKVCDRGAVRKVLLYGLIVFSTGALFCSLSPWFPMLLLFRVVQGVGAAMLACSVVMMGVKTLPSSKIAYVFAAATMGESLGSVFGPLYGGLVSDYLSWEWVFLVNVPIGFICYLVLRGHIPGDEFSGMKGFDYMGSLFLFAAMVSGLQFIEMTSVEGFSVKAGVTLLIFLATFISFIMRNLRVSDPIIDFSLFRNKGISASILVYILVVMCGMGATFILPFYMSKVLEMSTMMNGFCFFLCGLVTLVICFRVGPWVVKYGTRPFAILCCVIVLLMSLCLTFIQSNPFPLLIATLVLMGLLWGFGDASLGTRIINQVSDRERPSCSALCTFIGYLSVVLGTTMSSSLFNISSGEATESITLLTVSQFMDGYLLAVVAGILLSVVALALAWIVKYDDRGRSYDDYM